MARPTTAARRYAEAAFELAQRDGTLDVWERDLATAAGALADERVKKVVESPAVALRDRHEVLTRLLGDRISAPALNLVRLLARRGRIDEIARVEREFHRLLNRQRGVVEATVASPTPLTSDELATLTQQLQSMTGSTIDLRSEIDPDLIGGLTVRVGDRLLDASVRGRLERLRGRLLTGTR